MFLIEKLVTFITYYFHQKNLAYQYLLLNYYFDYIYQFTNQNFVELLRNFLINFRTDKKSTQFSFFFLLMFFYFSITIF
jgi:hypothetical protein